MRRGGPWNRELELYYGLTEQRQVTSIHEDKAVEHQANADDRAEKVSKNRLRLAWLLCNVYSIPDNTLYL